MCVSFEMLCAPNNKKKGFIVAGTLKDNLWCSSFKDHATTDMHQKAIKLFGMAYLILIQRQGLRSSILLLVLVG